MRLNEKILSNGLLDFVLVMVALILLVVSIAGVDQFAREIESIKYPSSKAVKSVGVQKVNPIGLSYKHFSEENS